MRRFAAGLGLAFAAGCGASEPPPVDSVVLIVVDTLRADRLGFHGHDRDTSPGLDAWAARGVVFEHASAPSPWTLPSFGTLYTGRLPIDHRAGAFHLKDAETFSRARADVPQLAELMKEAGLATATFATNRFLDPAFGLTRGFDLVDQAPTSDANERRADRIVDRALDWIDRQAGAPLFLALHLIDPHFPYAPPASARGRFTGAIDGATLELPVTGLLAIRNGTKATSAPDRAFVAAAYDEEIAFTDRQIARFLDGLADRGRTERTLIVFTSDHGEELFDHGGFEHGHTMYQELLHVPLVLWAPGLGAGRRSPPVGLIDVLPTICDYLGVEAPPVEGRSLRPLAERAEGTETDLDRPLYAHASVSGVRHGRREEAILRWPLKLMRAGNGEVRLFDLAADPGETIDLAAERPEAVRRMGVALDARFADTMRTDDVPVELDETALEELRALGYVED